MHYEPDNLPSRGTAWLVSRCDDGGGGDGCAGLGINDSSLREESRQADTGIDRQLPPLKKPDFQTSRGSGWMECH